MYIQNFRLGLATNSSSSHSIVWAPNRALGIRDDLDGDYGWGNFTLATYESKRDYIASMLVDYDHTNLQEVVSFFDLKSYWEPSSIDHQSNDILSPKLVTSKNPLARVFLGELREWLRRDDVIILGGNDNSDGHPLYKNHPLISVQDVLQATSEAILGNNEHEVMYDNGSWVIFNANPKSGWRYGPYKVRWTFDPEKEVGKSNFPELVDIKITDFCPFGCKWCYQASTLEGVHAPFERIEAIAHELASLGCFEVALGGGEPTLHPDFKRILKVFESVGILANFTTRNVKFLEEEGIFDTFKGNVAISVETGKDVQKINDMFRKYEIRDRIVLHYVMGSSSLEEMKKILAYGFNTTLLGFKTTGFGSTFDPHDYSDWRSALDDLLMGKDSSKDDFIYFDAKIGIDTALANQSDMSGIPPHLYYTEEGRFSFYIDAVKNTFAPSSFCPSVLEDRVLVLPLESVKKAWEVCPIVTGDALWHPPKITTRFERLLQN